MSNSVNFSFIHTHVASTCSVCNKKKDSFLHIQKETDKKIYVCSYVCFLRNKHNINKNLLDYIDESI